MQKRTCLFSAPKTAAKNDQKNIFLFRAEFYVVDGTKCKFTFLFPFHAYTMTGVGTAAFTADAPTACFQNECFSLSPGSFHITHLIPKPSALSPLDSRTVDASSTAMLRASMQANSFLFSDLWRLQCCGVVVRHQPCLVNVAHFSADFAHQSPATIFHVTVSLRHRAALEVCLDPVNAILGAWLVVHETCVMNLLTRVCRQLFFTQQSTLA